MKKVVVVAMLLWLTGCQLAPVAVPPTETAVAEPESESVPLAEEVAAEATLVLALDEQASSLQAWLDYKQQILVDPEPERARLRELTEFDAVAQLQLALLSLHPDMPYLTRFRVQTQLAEMVSAFPPRLAALFGWELTFNQKLLEAESAVSAVTRLNAQQQNTLDRLQKTNRELQKKIDALTQIEAELNQPSVIENTSGAKNGQG